MIDGLRRYEGFRLTDSPWLPELPSAWAFERAKYSFREADETSANGDEELLSVSHKTGVTPRSQKTIHMFMAGSYAGHKICRPGDIAVNTMWAWMAALGVARHIGIVSPAYGVYRPLSDGDFEPSYLDYLLRTETYRAEYFRSSRGITTSRLRLYPSDFLEIPFVQPPLDEQRKIVRFLDWHGSQVAKLLRAKQSVLKLVAEERESLTHDVIESSDRDVRLALVADKVFRPVVRDNSETYTPIGLFNRGRGIFHKEPTLGSELGDSTFNWIEKDELILSGQFAWEGSIAIVGSEDVGCIASHRYHALRPKAGVMEVTYLSSFFKTSFGHLLLNEHSRGAAGRNRPLNINTLLKEHIPLPAPEDQRRLVEIVTLESQLAASIKSLSTRLHEFRTRLIEDVVLGRLAIPDDTSDLLDDGVLEPAAIDYFDESDEDSDVEEEV